LSRIRFVVFVDQDHDRLAIVGVGVADQITETAWNIVVVPVTVDAEALAIVLDQAPDALIQSRAAVDHPSGEIQHDDRRTLFPVPAIMDIESAKEFFAALEQFFERIEEQALAEPAWTREEIGSTVLRQGGDVRGFIHIAETTLAQLAEGLDADR
jgi:hypothetical protein